MPSARLVSSNMSVSSVVHLGKVLGAYDYTRYRVPMIMLFNVSVNVTLRISSDADVVL